MMVDTVRTETDLLTNTFQDGQPDDSITAQDMRDLVVSTKYLNGQGWDFHLDSIYTSGSTKVILAGVRTKVTIDGVLGDVGHPEVEHNGSHFWNVTTNKIVPSSLNDFGIVRFAVRGLSTVAAENRFEVELDVGGTSGVIFQETGVFAKGAGAEQAFNFIIPLFAGTDFIANGGELYVTPEADAEFWEHGLTAARIYIAAL